MISADKFWSPHLGGKNDALGSVVKLEQDTIQKEAEAIALKCRDWAKSALDPEAFEARVQQLREISENEITGDVPAAVAKVAKKVNLSAGEESAVLNNLIKDADLSQYGVLNAVTKTAHTMDLSYDRSNELEQIGGKILTLSKTDWTEIATAKKKAA